MSLLRLSLADCSGATVASGKCNLGELSHKMLDLAAASENLVTSLLPLGSL